MKDDDNDSLFGISPQLFLHHVPMLNVAKVMGAAIKTMLALN